MAEISTRFVLTEGINKDIAVHRVYSLLREHDNDDRVHVLAIVDMDTNILEILGEDWRISPETKSWIGSIKGIVNRINQICVYNGNVTQALSNEICSLRLGADTMSAFDTTGKRDEQLWDLRQKLNYIEELNASCKFGKRISSLEDLAHRTEYFPNDLDKSGYNDDTGYDEPNAHTYLVVAQRSDDY